MACGPDLPPSQHSWNRPVSPLLGLPPELVGLVMAQADQASQAALALTCRRASNLVTPILYANVSVVCAGRGPGRTEETVATRRMTAFLLTLQKRPELRGVIRSLTVPRGHHSRTPEVTEVIYDSWLENFATQAAEFRCLHTLEILAWSLSISIATFAQHFHRLPALQALRIDQLIGREDRAAPLPVLNGVRDLTLTTFIIDPSFVPAPSTLTLAPLATMFPKVERANLSGIGAHSMLTMPDLGDLRRWDSLRELLVETVIGGPALFRGLSGLSWLYRLDICFQSHLEDPQDAFRIALPNVRSFGFPRLDRIAIQSLTHAVEEGLYPRLESLDFILASAMKPTKANKTELLRALQLKGQKWTQLGIGNDLRYLRDGPKEAP